MIFPSGKTARCDFLRALIAIAIAKVRGPTLPRNMVKISNALLMLCNPGVIPVDKPTVPKAEVTSYSTLIKLIFSTSDDNDCHDKNKKDTEPCD